MLPCFVAQIARQHHLLCSQNIFFAFLFENNRSIVVTVTVISLHPGWESSPLQGSMHIHTHTRTHSHIEVIWSNQSITFLDCGRKQNNILKE